jgi:ATP-dependent exoDNAse (exonuclease V) beta subunit
MDSERLDSAIMPGKASHEPIPIDWQSVARNEYTKLHELLCSTPSSRSLPMATQASEVFGSEDAAREDRMPETSENRAARLGTAFHEAMERADLLCQNNGTPWLQELIMRFGLDRESAQKLREMVDLSLASELIERARKAMRFGGRILREVPFVRPLNGSTIEEGKIDLLFEEETGWVLVDYKTDWVSKDQTSAEAFFRDKYFAQIREYRNALETLSIRVLDAYLLLARTGNMVQMP